jgi:DNA-binding response OmpR family regulator
MNTSSMTPLVLVADDEPTMLELVSRHLKTMENPKVEVIEASDGEQAWRLAREHLPDLVVLDVMMPGMSGWEVCRKIREEVALAHTGVVMLTGIGENLNQMTSPLYGADAYIDKPFEFGELDSKVKNALLARASQRDGVTRPSVNGVGGPAQEPSVAASDVPFDPPTQRTLGASGPRMAVKKARAAGAKAQRKTAAKKVVAKAKSKISAKASKTKRSAPKARAASKGKAKRPAAKKAATALSKGAKRAKRAK